MTKHTNEYGVDETEQCYLIWGEEGFLDCTYKHTDGALCLANKCQYCRELQCVCYIQQAQGTKFGIHFPTRYTLLGKILKAFGLIK